MKKIMICLLAVTALTLNASPLFASEAPVSEPAANGTCTSLVVGATGSTGAAGVGLVTILLVNSGPQCEISGYPEVNILNASGASLGIQEAHKSSMVLGMPRPKEVSIAHNGVASFGIAWPESPVGIEKCQPAGFADVMIRLNGSSQVWIPPVHITICGPVINVSSIEAGPRPSL